MKKSARILSLVLAMIMMFSSFSILASAKEVEVAQTSATVTSNGDARLYFNMKAVSWWTAGTNGNGNFAYFFNNSTGKYAWSAHAVKYSGDTYYVVIPSGSWSGVILTRNNTSTSPSWSNKWNQTGDITMSSSSNYLSKFSEGSTSATWGTAIKPSSTATVTASSTAIELGETVNLSTALSSNASLNTIKSVTYSAATGSVENGVYTPSVEGDDTVTATVTYYPNAYSSLTSTTTATVTITATAPVVETEPEASPDQPTQPEVVETQPEVEPTEPEASPDQPTEEPTEAPTEAPVEKTAYCINSAAWEKVSAYAWIEGGDALTWPGVLMNKTEDKVNGFDVYEITFNVDYTNIIFNNSDNGKQTSDLTFEDGKYFDLKSGEWYASLDEVPAIDKLATDRYLVGSFNDWNTLKNEFKLDAEDSRTGYVSLELAANTTYEFKIIREGAWTSNATAITADVEGLTFSSSVDANAKITTAAAGTYVFSFGMDSSQLSVKYPVVEVPTEPEATGDQPATEPEATEPEVVEPEFMTIYFQNNWKWSEVTIYFWGSKTAENPAWPGVKMDFYKNDGTYDIYSAQVPTDIEGIIINGKKDDGSGAIDQTPDIKAGFYDGICYYMVWDNGNQVGFEDISVMFPTQPEVEPTEPEASDDQPATGDQPATEPEATQPEVEPTQPEVVEPEFMTIYFQNNWKWSEVSIYFWGSKTAENPTWPGVKMDFYKNDGTYDIYATQVPTDIEGLIINGKKDDGSGAIDQTPDIKEGFYDGICYYMKWDNGNQVGFEDISVMFPTQPEVEPTEEATPDQPTQPEVEPTQPEVEPTQPEATEPEVTDVTLRFAAPTSTTNRYNWSMKDVVFFYGNTTTFADNTLVTMTATADKYYTEDTGVNTLIKDNNGWTVYEVKLTAEQVAEAQAAKFVGFATADGVNRTTLTSPSNVLKAGIDTYGAYGDANTLADLNGKTFVIKDAEWGATSAISYVGYWLTDYNTIKFAAPVSLTQNSNWEDVEFFYANGGSFDTATKLQMVNTLDTTKITEPGSSYLRAGNWYIYAVSVDANVAAEIEAATNVGFARPGASNKTGFSRNVLKAKVDEYDGTYLAEAKTLDEVEGMVFVVQAPATANSYLTFHGEWQTAEKYTAGNDDLITIRFAAPIGATPASKWDTGVELYYGDTTNYRATERIAMTKTGETVEVTVDNTVLQSVVSGEWEVYEVQLTLEQVKAIDNAKAVGFIKAGSWNRTSTNFYRNIVRASKIDGNTAYKGVRESIETFDGLTFVISGEYDERYETTTYLGSWIG